ncbi:MAG: shikimate kinase, partial [Candidatus Nanopelagicales bacterium]
HSFVDSVHTNEGGPVVVLVGVPGAGKSTVGRALAARLGVGFRDTDADIEASTGRVIADIFVESGEPEFRRLEATAVALALREHPGVLALGGGAVTDPDTRALLAEQPTVWLRVGLAAAAQRAGLGGARPVLMGNIRSQVKGLMDARAGFYTEVATQVVDTDHLSIDESVDAICAGLGLAAETRPVGASERHLDPTGSPAPAAARAPAADNRPAESPND